jgi:hypothetical protein
LKKEKRKENKKNKHKGSNHKDELSMWLHKKISHFWDIFLC